MVKINLLPKEDQKRTGALGQLVLFTFIGILSILAFIGGWIYLSNQIDGLKKDIRRLEARLEELKPKIAEIEKFKADKKDLEGKREAILKLEKDQKVPVRLLDEIYKTLEKEEVWLTAFNKAGDKLSISGVALSNPAISNYLRKLEESPYIKNVELIISTESKIFDRTVRNFQISCELESPGETKEAKAK